MNYCQSHGLNATIQKHYAEIYTEFRYEILSREAYVYGFDHKSIDLLFEADDETAGKLEIFWLLLMHYFLDNSKNETRIVEYFGWVRSGKPSEKILLDIYSEMTNVMTRDHKLSHSLLINIMKRSSDANPCVRNSARRALKLLTIHFNENEDLLSLLKRSLISLLLLPGYIFDVNEILSMIEMLAFYEKIEPEALIKNYLEGFNQFLPINSVYQLMGIYEVLIATNSYQPNYFISMIPKEFICNNRFFSRYLLNAMVVASENMTNCQSFIMIHNIAIHFLNSYENSTLAVKRQFFQTFINLLKWIQMRISSSECSTSSSLVYKEICTEIYKSFDYSIFREEWMIHDRALVFELVESILKVIDFNEITVRKFVNADSVHFYIKIYQSLYMKDLRRTREHIEHIIELVKAKGSSTHCYMRILKVFGFYEFIMGQSINRTSLTIGRGIEVTRIESLLKRFDY